MTIRAAVIKTVRLINVRCLACGLFFSWFFLAIKERGANQQLNMIRGVAMESDARINESLCQEETQ